MNENTNIPESEEKAIRVEIAPHKKTAWLLSDEGVKYSVEKLREALNNAGVVKGINEEYLKLAASGEKLLRSQPIANAVPPQAGASAKLNYLMSDEVGAKLKEDGRLDFREINLIKNVTENQPLAVKIPHQLGEVGYLVTGEEVPGKMGKDFDIKIFCGPGVKIMPDKENVILAAVNGAYKRDKSGRISVSEVFKVDSDVDYRTGNIRCSASAEIEGDVKAGFEVHVEGDLEVKGLVENADIEVKGDLAVRYGFTQGAAPVTVGGELRAMYIYNRSLIKAGSLQIKEMIGFSDLIVDGDVTANRIVGGKIIAKGDIVCEEIGSAQHESKTYIIAGLDFAKKKERDKVKEEFEEEREALQKLRKENVDLAKWAAEFKKNAGKVMEEITQIASSEIAAKVQQNLKQKIARIREITFEIENLENFIKENEVKIEELNKALQNPKAKVIVNGTVFAGVHITIGENAVYQLKNPRRKVQFRLNNEGEIIVENL